MFYLSGILSSCLSLQFLFICVHVICGLNVLSCLIWSEFVIVSFRCPALLTICCLRYCYVIINIFLMPCVACDYCCDMFKMYLFRYIQALYVNSIVCSLVKFNKHVYSKLYWGLSLLFLEPIKPRAFTS